VQTPPPGFPPQWGSSPNDPQAHSESGIGGYDQAPYLGYGAPPPAVSGYPPAGYGQQPSYGPAPWTAQGAQPTGPTPQQTISGITFAAIGLLGLLGAILTLTLWINASSAASRATDMCERFGGEYSTLCRQHIENVVPPVPAALVTCLFIIIAAGLAATAGAVMLFLKNQLGQFLILSGGFVMLVLSISCEARYGATGRLTYDLVAGFVVAAAGGLMLIPAFRMTLGLPPNPTGGPPPGGFQGVGQWPPYGQPQPPQHGSPGPGGYPPPHW
jgi:hypothetical protein